MWQWLHTAHNKARDHRNELQNLHQEVEERVTRYDEKVHQRFTPGRRSPGTVDTESSQCATQQDLETVQVQLSNKILQVEEDMVQYQEKNERAVDDVKRKPGHRDVELKTTVENVRTTENQKIKSCRKLWRHTRED